MSKSVLNLSFFSLALTCVSFKMCERTHIKLHSLISNLPPECQIKVTSTFLESHNLQESKVPFEIIQLQLPNSTNPLFSSNISEVFGFIPRPANRSNCAINFHYFRQYSNHKGNRWDTSPVKVFTYSIYISSGVLKTDSQKVKQYRHIQFPYNIWLINSVKFRSVERTYPFVVSKQLLISLIFGHPKDFKAKFDPSPQLLSRLVIIRYTSKSKQSQFCPTLAFESISNVERNCVNMSTLYNHMSKRDLNIHEWKAKLRKKFTVHVKRCKPAWIFAFSQSWPEIDTLNIFQSRNIYEALAHQLVSKSNETAGGVPDGECTGYIYKDTIPVENERNTITSVESTKLFTCYEAPKVSFYMYATPLDSTAWLLVSTQAVIVWCLLRIFMISKYIKSSFSPLLFIIGTMIEEAKPVPIFFKTSAAFKVLIISWVLVAMLLSSCYQSILVVELNSPLKGHTPSSLDETFCPIEEDLLDIKGNQANDESVGSLLQFWQFTRSSKQSDNELPQRTLRLELQHKYTKLDQNKNCFAILLYPTEKNYVLWSFGLNWNFLPTFYFNLQFAEYNESRHPKLLKAMIKRNHKLSMGLLSPLSRHFYLLDDTDADKMVSNRFWTYLRKTEDNNDVALTALEWEITRNEKIFVIGPDCSLANEIVYLKNQYFVKNCKIFPESLAIKTVWWGFWRNFEHKLDRYFRQLVETGIYSIAVKNKNYRMTLTRLNGSRLVMEENNKGFLNMRVQSVKLNGSVQTIFELWGLLLILAVCWLTGEICFQNAAKFAFNLHFWCAQLVFKELRKFGRKMIAISRFIHVQFLSALFRINHCLERLI